MATELEYLEAIAGNTASNHGDLSTVAGYISGNGQKLDAISDKVNAIFSAMPNAGNGNDIVDYSEGIEYLCKMVAYTDLLLVVLLIFVVLLSGMVLGLSVTRWLKARRE